LEIHVLNCDAARNAARARQPRVCTQGASGKGVAAYPVPGVLSSSVRAS
jgi:hypothetical protein